MAGLKSVRGEGRLVGVVPAMGANGGGCVGGSAVEGADQAVVGQICLQRQLPYGPRNWCVRAYFCLCVFVCVCVWVFVCVWCVTACARAHVPACVDVGGRTTVRRFAMLARASTAGRATSHRMSRSAPPCLIHTDMHEGMQKVACIRMCMRDMDEAACVRTIATWTCMRACTRACMHEGHA